MLLVRVYPEDQCLQISPRQRIHRSALARQYNAEVTTDHGAHQLADQGIYLHAGPVSSSPVILAALTSYRCEKRRWAAVSSAFETLGSVSVSGFGYHAR